MKEAEASGTPFNEAEYAEKAFMAKKELNGNMDFIGELYISNILRDKIAQDILTSLLQETKITSDTVEAALRFISKIGPVLEKKYDKAKDEKGKQIKFLREDYEKIIEEFRNVMNNNQQINTRIRMLIKNMIENKESGWEKQQQESNKIKTKEEIEREQALKLAQEARERAKDEDHRPNNRGDRRDDHRGDNRNTGYGNAKRNQRRDGDSMYIQKQQSQDGGRGKGGRRRRDDGAGRHDGTPKQKVEKFEVTEDKIGAMMANLFKKLQEESK